MPNTTLDHLDTRLKEALHRVQRLRERDDADEDELRKALDESRSLLGAIARYRYWLEQTATPRCAA